jgi:hypothetical protein
MAAARRFIAVYVGDVDYAAPRDASPWLPREPADGNEGDARSLQADDETLNRRSTLMMDADAWTPPIDLPLTAAPNALSPATLPLARDAADSARRQPCLSLKSR